MSDVRPGIAGQEQGGAKGLGVRVAFILILLLIWHAVVASGRIPAYLLPGPLDVAKTFWDKILYDYHTFRLYIGLDTGKAPPEQPSLAISILQSLARMAVGYGTSVIGGILLGVLLARSWILKQTVGSLILSLQSLPSICWLPFALIWFGLNERAILVVIILGAMFSIAISTEGAIRNIPPIYVKVGRTLGARNFTLAKDILFFAALPELIGGLKVGWTFAWRSLMAAELIRQDVIGVGHLLETGRQFNDMALMFAAVFTILAIGITVDMLVFGRLEKTIRRRWGLER